MTLDVVIVTYQSAHLVPRAIESLPEGTSVIVVDNRSIDGSADVAEALGCRVLRNDVNAGFGAAVNRAIREAVTADVVLLLNPDATVTPGAIDRLLAAFDDPTVAVAGARLRNDDGTDQRPWWPFPSPGGQWREAFGMHRAAPPDYHESADVDFVVGACFAVRTSAFESIGGFDERYWLYGEETDLCRRLRDRGWVVRYVAEAVATHVAGASGDAIAPLVNEHFERGADRFVLAYHGRAALVSFRVAKLVGSLFRLPFLPRRDPRRAERRFIVERLVRALCTHPTSVSNESDSAPGSSLVVLSLEPWDEVWRRNQFFVRELVALHPERPVLFVEPSYDLSHDLIRRRRISWSSLRTTMRLRPVHDFPQVTCVRLRKVLPRLLGGARTGTSRVR